MPSSKGLMPCIPDCPSQGFFSDQFVALFQFSHVGLFLQKTKGLRIGLHLNPAQISTQEVHQDVGFRDALSHSDLNG